MFNVYIKGHPFAYEPENVARLFGRKAIAVAGVPKEDDEEYAFLRQTQEKGQIRLLCVVKTYWLKAFKDAYLPLDTGADACELALSLLLYDLLCLVTDKPPEWGVLTGVRPAKYANRLLAGGMTQQQALRFLCGERRVSDKKARLALMTAQNARSLVRRNRPDRYSLYVSIPFCPTRCSYCSFISKTVDRDLGLLDTYLGQLCEELSLTAEIAHDLGLHLDSIYIGGGTPSVLSADQLARLCGVIGEKFADCSEYTVEAGRPDTLTPEKLRVLRRAGVGRISINPQTANDTVLQNIARPHSAADIERAFGEARLEGFAVINADLIAGLPGDSFESFCRTLSWLQKLAPENITLHALTRKRSSRFAEDAAPHSRYAGAMVDYAAEKLPKLGYAPYYMYRQKGTVGGLENTGYALPGTACLYNLYMMDELQTVLSCGAGAVTKLVDQKTGRIKRVFNYKYPAEYLSGFDALAARKEQIRTFYG